MTTIPTIQLPPTLQTLAFLAEQYEADGDDINAHQVAQALVTVWKAGNLDQPCPSCHAHTALTPDQQIKAARDLLNQAMALTPLFQDG